MVWPLGRCRLVCVCVCVCVWLTVTWTFWRAKPSTSFKTSSSAPWSPRSKVLTHLRGSRPWSVHLLLLLFHLSICRSLPPPLPLSIAPSWLTVCQSELFISEARDKIGLSPHRGTLSCPCQCYCFDPYWPAFPQSSHNMFRTGLMCVWVMSLWSRDSLDLTESSLD